MRQSSAVIEECNGITTGELNKRLGHGKMIGEKLWSVLLKRFGHRGPQPGTSPDVIAVFPAAHPEVGDLTIWDHGDEATVAIGKITHGHFNPYDNSLTPEESAQRVTEEVIEFLNDLFADKVLLHKSRDGRSGGWRLLDDDTSNSRIDADDLAYLWSGPIQNPDSQEEP